MAHFTKKMRKFSRQYIITLDKVYRQNRSRKLVLLVTKNFLMVQAPGFIRGINPFSKIENPQAPAFIRGVNLKSKI